MQTVPDSHISGFLRPEAIAQLDASCPEQKLHRLLVICENYLTDLMLEGAGDTKLVRNLVFAIKHLFNIRIKLEDLRDRVKIRQQREIERQARVKQPSKKAGPDQASVASKPALGNPPLDMPEKEPASGPAGSIKKDEPSPTSDPAALSTNLPCTPRDEGLEEWMPHSTCAKNPGKPA